METSQRDMNYGQELIMDLHGCNPTTYDTREKIEAFFVELCERIGVEAAQLNWWDYAGRPREYAKADPRWKGTSAVQFILTSSIVIHTLDELRCVYLNVFSCDTFDGDEVLEFALQTFGGHLVQKHDLERK